MKDNLREQRDGRSVPLVTLDKAGLAAWRETQSDAVRRWLEAVAFEARPATHCLVPGPDGSLAAVLVGAAEKPGPWELSDLPGVLPAGDYHLDGDPAPARREALGLGWALGCYRYDEYRDEETRATKRPRAVLALDDAQATEAVREMSAAVCLVRDLINPPTEALPPAQLAATCEELATQFGASCSVTTGDDLLRTNFPAVHAVGRAAAQAPCLIDLQWGDPSHPRVAIVGKGVCFDSGGLDIKPASGMRLMKKDMGGGAHAIALAQLVMTRKLPVRLHLVVPAVENAISGNAYRPGDVIRTRKGITAEIDNTDAEGRVILSDALAYASESAPQLMVDFATLTGAARVAVGTELPAMFCNDDALAQGILEQGLTCDDPVWRLPLHAPYRAFIESKVADIQNAGSVPYGGAITAALFLERFVGESIPWAHFDIMGWNIRARPGRPEGGEAMGLRAVYAHLAERFR